MVVYKEGQVDFGFSILEFHDNYVISRMKQDQVMTGDQFLELKENCLSFFGEKPFGFISHRIHDNNVDPTVYLNLKEPNSLCGIAVVSERAETLRMATFEKQFSRFPFELFVELEDAAEWVEELVKKKKADL